MCGAYVQINLQGNSHSLEHRRSGVQRAVSPLPEGQGVSWILDIRQGSQLQSITGAVCDGYGAPHVKIIRSKVYQNRIIMPLGGSNPNLIRDLSASKFAFYDTSLWFNERLRKRTRRQQKVSSQKQDESRN